MNTGQRIAQRRKQLDMTQEELAFAIGTHQKQISRYENGVNDPTGDKLVIIARALNTTTDWLLGETEYPEKPAYIVGDLDTEEKLVIQMLRSKDDEMKKKIIDAIKTLAG